VSRFIERHPAWALIVLIAVALLLWLVFAVWPPGLEEAIGRKKVFLNAVFNGITLGGLYFLVASGFTLIHNNDTTMGVALSNFREPRDARAQPALFA